MTGTIHVIGATGAILSGLIIVWILFGAWYWLLLVLVSALKLSRVEINPIEKYHYNLVKYPVVIKTQKAAP